MRKEKKSCENAVSLKFFLSYPTLKVISPSPPHVYRQREDYTSACVVVVAHNNSTQPQRARDDVGFSSAPRRRLVHGGGSPPSSLRCGISVSCATRVHAVVSAFEGVWLTAWGGACGERGVAARPPAGAGSERGPVW